MLLRIMPVPQGQGAELLLLEFVLSLFLQRLRNT
jgi:hypothetical protein